MPRNRRQERGLYTSFRIEDDAPCCAHGPKLRVERKNGRNPSYSCSAFRNQAACRSDSEFSANLHRMQLFTSSLSDNDRKSICFCHTCGVLYIDPSHDHLGHNTVCKLSDFQLNAPSYFLETLEKSSEHAQYFFSEEWLEFMVSTLRALRIDNILCVGTPRLFDSLRLQNLSMNKFLLDLDARLESFYPFTQFARFNALNGYFFTSAGKLAAETFMSSCKGRTVIFCDPPFGVLMEPLVISLNNLKKSITNSEVFLMITIPYFLGKKLFKAAPELKMLDYKVTYVNHVRFMSTGHDGNNSKRRISVVRLFTDVPSQEIKPPKGIENQYWFCEICQRYSDSTNKHCQLCKACTTMHGDTYNHCTACNACRPPSYQHCNKCNRCFRIKDNEFHPCANEESNEQPKPKRKKSSQQ
ncbi:hypothetical protein Aperf_G00000037203 [Anoplocephala perfoliata]